MSLSANKAAETLGVTKCFRLNTECEDSEGLDHVDTRQDGDVIK